MNKKTKQSLVAGLAAVMGTGIVAPVVNAATQTLPAQYEEAFKATEKAVNSKNQKEMTQARALVDALYANVKGTKNEYLATTLSAMLDPVQQVKLNELFAGAEKADKSLSQADINAIRNLIVDMPEVWKKPYSANLVDPIQQKLITKTVEATKKATDSKLQADKDVAQALLADLKTATNNDGVVAWANGYQSELDKIVVKLEVAAVSPVNSTTLTITGAGLKQLKATDITIPANSVASITPSADEKTATVTLDAKMAPDRETTVTVKVGEENKEFKVKYGYGVTSVALNETTYDDDRANQILTFKVNGQGTDATVEYLELAGYQVKFVATNAIAQKDAAGTLQPAGSAALIFDAGIAGSSTGKLKTGIPVGQYNVQMQVMKDGVVTTSTTGKINVANIDANVNSIASVYFVNGPLTTAEYNGTLTGNQFIMNSTKLVEGDTANVYAVSALVNNVEMDVAQGDISVESSNPAVISVNASKELKANSKGTAVITVKVGNQTKTFNFTVETEARKLTSVTASKSVKTAVNVPTTVRFKTFDQYGDPISTVSNDIQEIAAKNAAGTEIFAATAVDIVTIDKNSIGVKDIPVTPTVAGQGTVYFKDANGKVIGSVYVDVTDNGSVNSRKLVLMPTTTSTDATLDLNSTNDNTVSYGYYKYNPNGVSLGREEIALNQTVGKYSIESANPQVAAVAMHATAANAVTITAVKAGVTDIVVKDENGVIVDRTTITVTNTAYALTDVTFKSVPKVDYAGKQVKLSEILNLTASTGDDIVEGVTLSKASASKVRMVKTMPAYTTVPADIAALAVNDLYLDLDNNGVYSSGDVKLGTVSVVAASDFTGTGTINNGIYTSVAGDKGTIIVKIMNPKATSASTIKSTFFTVDVK